jgi:hypothetical protein
MFATFRQFSWLLLVVRCSFGVIGLNARWAGWIECSEDGLGWLLTSENGKIFVTGHVIALMLIIVMMEQIFGHASIHSGLIAHKEVYSKGRPTAVDGEILKEAEEHRIETKGLLKIIVDKPQEHKLGQKSIDMKTIEKDL